MSKCRYDLSEYCNNTDCLTCVLDKIKAEIAEEICLTDNPYTKETKYTIEHSRLLEILDKYKVESEGWE